MAPKRGSIVAIAVQLYALRSLDAALPGILDRVGLEVDAGWALAGDADPAALMDAHADRITRVHAADVDLDRGESVALGDGDVDRDAVVASARTADAEWLVYEHDDPADPIASMEREQRALWDALR